jgi:hypothetical protein
MQAVEGFGFSTIQLKTDLWAWLFLTEKRPSVLISTSNSFKDLI